MTVTLQSFWSIVRQVAAFAAIVFAALTQALGSIKLSPVASAVLGVFGIVILGIEHYVGDPSTGTPAAPSPTASVPPRSNTPA